MGRALFEPLLQNLGHRPANGLLLLAAATPDCLNQRFGQAGGERGLGFWHRSQLQVALGLQKIAVSLATTQTPQRCINADKMASSDRCCCAVRTTILTRWV